MSTNLKRILSLVLSFVLVAGCLPIGALAQEAETTAPVVEEVVETSVPADETEASAAPETEPSVPESTVAEETEAVLAEAAAASEAAAEAVVLDTDAMDEALEYILALTINNSKNDPSTVVQTHGTHFTWDNEKRESSKSYLFDWSYYNGVVFEGLEYLYEETGDEVYKDYVLEYMSSLIDKDGTWATCTNNSSRECAGYNASHGADCYKTASLLLDAYEMSGDSRYLTMAKTLYADLDSAASSYSLSKAGNNYRHTWASDPSPDLWLDGLYMILPFRAEYAKYIGDTEELDLIVSRMQWVSDNMYNGDKGLFYHAADSASSNSGTYWLRSIGWYAAAIVDIMDSMSGSNLEAMKAQLVKLVDGMKACQNTSNGMWLNNMAASQSSSNPYETSGTALVCYAVMKAVNEGWLDESYADMAILAFNGICDEKLDGSNLTDICFKGAPGSSNSTFYDNEGKGVGPFIMLYAELVEYTGIGGGDSTPELPVNTLTYQHTNGDQIIASAKGLTAITAAMDETIDYSTIFDTNNAYGAYRVALEGCAEGADVELTLSVYGVQEEKLAVYAVALDGTVTEITEYTPFRSADAPEYLNVTFHTTDTDGIYAIGTRAVIIPEDAVLTRVEITAEPETRKYFVEDASALASLSLDITGLEVQATYANETESVTKTIGWNEFDETKDGYSLTFDMTKTGTQEVTVSYAYGGVTLSDTFTIEVYEKVVGDTTVPEVRLELTVPGTVTVEVVEKTGDAAVKAALEDLCNAYIAYDFTLAGYTQGDAVKVTMPLPEGEGMGVVYYVPADGSAPQRVQDAQDNGDGTITFTATHFSTYAGARAGGSGSLVGGEIYTLDTNGISADKKYLIVSGSSGNVSALTNNNGSAGSTTVTVDGSTITVEDDSDIAWVFSGTTGTAKNGSRYIYLGSSVLSASERTLNITSSGNGAYTIKHNGSSYWLRYNGSWSRSNNSATVYLYEYTGSSDGGTVNFTVTVEPSAVLKPGDEAKLTAAVTLNGETVDLSDCTIAWESGDTAVATVSDGVVTGVEDGTAEITATLSAVNGTALEDPIVLTVSITVQSKTPTGIKLSSTSGYVVRNKGLNTVITDENGEAVTITVTYDDGSTDSVSLTLGHIVGDYDITRENSYSNQSVTYQGFTVEGFTLNVTQNPGNNFPEYPDEGSVDVNKIIGDNSQFQNTGVAEVQLSTSGIPVKRGVDVVLVADISNSMAWKAGSKNVSPGNGETTKWQDLQTAAGTFIDILLANNEDGTATANTVSFVTFGGYDAQRNNNAEGYSTYFDATQIAFTSYSNATEAKSEINAYSITGNDSNGYTMTINGRSAGAPQGGTNYDYAFLEAAAAINQVKAEYAAANNGESYDESGREIYVVFMTDGAPDHYNQLYYKTRSTSQFDYYALYKNTGDAIANYFDEHDLPSYANGFTKPQTNGYYLGNVSNANWINWLQRDSLAAAEYVAGMTAVNSITAIGFDLANGAFSDFSFGEDVLTDVLTNLAGEDSCEVMTTDDSTELNAFYASLASQIKQAATNAYFVDQMGSSFDLQMASSITKFAGTANEDTVELDPEPQITVSTYNIYSKNDVNGTTVTTDMVGTRYGNPTVVETVTFNADGTEAYSTVNGVTSGNIIRDGVITAVNFFYNTTAGTKTITLTDGSTYDLPAETFYWNIGTINEKEFVLSYYVYLTGSAEGKAEAGTYQTNNYATLYYTNWLDNDVNQSVQSPAVAWESAAVYYGFYLVDKDGNPVVNQTTGETGSFADAVKVTQKIFYDEVKLNDVEEVGTTIQVVSTMVPEGYNVYDEDAKYTITIDSGAKISGWEIVNGKAPDTTYVNEYRGTEFTNVKDSDELDQTGMDYTATTVWFAVVWEPQCIDDAVVIDYGLPVDISVLGNDMFGNYGTLIGVGDVNNKPADEYTAEDSANFAESFDSAYGTAALNKNTVRYTPDTMQMNGKDQFAYEVKYTVSGDATDLQYYYGTVTVIPATTVYYEDTYKDSSGNEYSFLTLNTYNKAGEKIDNAWTDAGSVFQGVTQAEDRPGEFSLPAIDANNNYGYDQAYDSSSEFSLGGAKKVTVSGTDYATAEFTFWGTGFDLISMTSSDTGFIVLQVVGEKGKTVNRMVDTYYGYEYGPCKVTCFYNGTEWVETTWEPTEETAIQELPENPTQGQTVELIRNHWYPAETDNALYQVPVINQSGLPYDKYTVTVTIAYNTALDHVETETDQSYDFYLDGIRIYDPAGVVSGEEEDETISGAYAADGEGWPQYQELRNILLTAKDFDAIAAGSGEDSTGVIFIDNESGTYKVSDYQSYGPNNELYLAPGQSVIFNLSVPASVADVQIGMKSADGKSVRVTMDKYTKNASGAYEVSGSTAVIDSASSSATDRFYSIGNHVAAGADNVLSFTNSDTNGILSITDFKFTFSANPNGVSTADFFQADSSAINAVLMLLNAEAEEEAPVVLPDADLSISVNKTSVKEGSSVTVKVTTSEAVDYLLVNGEKVTKYSQNKKTGRRSWNVKVEAEEAGDMAIVVTACSAEGLELDTAAETIQVTAKKSGSVNKIIGQLLDKLFG